MYDFNATVEFETKKGNTKTARIAVRAPTLQAAEQRAALEIRGNGQRQCKTIKSVQVVQARTFVEPKTGFFAKLFRRRRTSQPA